MWYEENNKFVRAPTPKTFDTLVQNLEDGDSVMFQSISLPSSKNQSNDDNKSSNNSTENVNNSNNSGAWKSILNMKTEDKSKGRSSSAIATVSPSAYNYNEVSDDDYDDDEEIRELKRQITQAEIENARRDKMIQSKDEQIESLKKQIKNLQGSPARATTSQSRRPTNDSDLIQFYKNQYETTLSNYQKLKEVLSLSANVSSTSNTKQSHSARPPPTRKLVKKQ